MFAKSNSKTSSPGTAFQPDYRLSTSYRRKPSSLPRRARKSRAALGLPIPLQNPAFGKDTMQICSREGQGPGPHLPLRTQATTTPPHLCPEHTPKHELSGQTPPRPSVTPGGSLQDPCPPRDKPISILSLTLRATPPCYAANLGTRHRRPIPRPQTPDGSCSPALPRKLRAPGTRCRPKPDPQGLYRVAGGSRSPARPAVAAPARKEPSCSGRRHAASCSRPGQRLHHSGPPSPDGGSGRRSHWERRGSARPGACSLLLLPRRLPENSRARLQVPGSAGSARRGWLSLLPAAADPRTAHSRAPRGLPGGPRYRRPAPARRHLAAPPPAPLRPAGAPPAPPLTRPAAS